MTKSILPTLSSCLRGKPFYFGKMTESEHNYKVPTPMNVTYARFEIQLIDLPRSQASQVFGRKQANDPEYHTIGHVSRCKGRWNGLPMIPIRSSRSRLPWRISLVPRSQNTLGILGTRFVTNPPERACRGTRWACPDCTLAVFDSRFVYFWQDDNIQKTKLPVAITSILKEVRHDLRMCEICAVQAEATRSYSVFLNIIVLRFTPVACYSFYCLSWW